MEFYETFRGNWTCAKDHAFGLILGKIQNHFEGFLTIVRLRKSRIAQLGRGMNATKCPRSCFIYTHSFLAKNSDNNENLTHISSQIQIKPG